MANLQPTVKLPERTTGQFVGRLLFLSLSYFVCGRLGLEIPYLGSHIALIWLPTGISVAALLRWGYHCWPGIFLGAFATNFSVDASPLLDSCIALGNTLGPLLTAGLLRRIEFRILFDRVYDIFLLVLSAAIGMLLSASGGVVSLVMFEVLPLPDSGAAWLSWWAGDFIGVLLAAPPLLSLSLAKLKELWTQRIEFMTWLAVVLFLGWAVFVLNNDAEGNSLPIVFVLLPVVVWSAMRFGILGSSLGVLVLAGTVAVATGLGLGPFYSAVVRQGLLLLWLYLATLVMVNLMVGTLKVGRIRAELDKQQGDLHFGEMFERHNSIMLLIDPESGRIVNANKSASRFYGYPLERLLTMNIAQINMLPPDEIAAERIRAKNENRNYFVFPHRLSSGDVRTVEVHSSPIETDGHILLFSIIHDITERKMAEQAIREAKERNEIIFNTSPNAVFISRLSDGNITDANDAFAKLTGYTKEQVIGNTTPGIHFWVYPEERDKYVSELKTKGFCEDFETHFRRNDGNIIVCDVSAGITTIQGVQHIIGTARDITETRLIQKQTEMLLSRYQTLMRTALDGFRVMDIQGNVVEANDAFCQMLGYTQEEALKLNVADWDVQWTKEELLERLKDFVGKSGTRFETVQRRKDGTLINVEVSATGVEIEGKNYFFASSRDITERKRIEQKNEVLIRRHQTLMRSTLEGIHIMDAVGNIVEVNDTFCRMLGYTQEEASKLNVADWDAQWSREELMERFKTLIRIDGALFETRHRRKDGSVIEVEVSTTGAEIDGRYYLYASSRDITERKNAEKTLRISRAREAEALQELRVMFDNSGEGFWKANTSGYIVEVNDAYCHIVDYPRDEIVGAHISKFEALEPTPGEVAEHIERIIASGTDRFETRHRHRDGHLVDIEIVTSYIKETDCVIAFLRDVSARKQIEEVLRIAAITFDTQEGIVITDAAANIVRVNQAFQDITGYSAAEAIGQNPRIFKSGRHDDAFYRDMWSELLDTGKWAGEVWDKRKNGELYPKLMTITAVRDDKQHTTHYVAVFRDISNRKRSEYEIHQLAFYDSLTQLPNRRLLIDRLQQAIAASLRNDRYGALLFLDMDHFKKINDTQGHAKGDQLLVEVARRLQASVRDGDSVARLGGDEFVVVLEGLSKEANEAATLTEMVAEKIRKELGRSYTLENYECMSSASIGISLFYGHHESVEDLLMHADVAMYQAKSAGRNAIRFFDPAMQTALDVRAALEADLRHALEKQEFLLHYQIQVDSQNRALGVELLLRWQHPVRGLISPMQFIPLCEETGLIVPIGLWVLQTACNQLKTWQHEVPTRELTLAVNVSARQFRQADFVDQVRHILAESGAKPGLLKLELTESTVLENIQDTISKMRELKSQGVTFSMDDFGMGYSSLQYLKRLPLDQIKIDQTFVRDIASDPNDAAIVQTIIAMTGVLGLNVIAEGVETEAQREFLDRNGCHAFQGNLFGKPVPSDQFEEILRGR